MRYISCLACVPARRVPLRAGELDAEFGPAVPGRPKTDTPVTTAVADGNAPLAIASDDRPTGWKASELDAETPTQAHGGGHGGGFGGGGHFGGGGFGGFGGGFGHFGGGGFGGFGRGFGFGGFGGFRWRLRTWWIRLRAWLRRFGGFGWLGIRRLRLGLGLRLWAMAIRSTAMVAWAMAASATAGLGYGGLGYGGLGYGGLGYGGMGYGGMGYGGYGLPALRLRLRATRRLRLQSAAAGRVPDILCPVCETHPPSGPGARPVCFTHPTRRGTSACLLIADPADLRPGRGGPVRRSPPRLRPIAGRPRPGACAGRVSAVARLANDPEIRKRLGLVPEYEDFAGIESVKVAVLDYGFDGVGSGRSYLPDSTVVVEHYDPDFVRRFGLGDPEYRKPFEPLNRHGRIMAQIVWAVTGSHPGGPQFYLLNASGPTMLRRAVRYAIEQKVDIILFSGSFEGGGNGDGRGPINAHRRRGARGQYPLDQRRRQLRPARLQRPGARPLRRLPPAPQRVRRRRAAVPQPPRREQRHRHAHLERLPRRGRRRHRQGPRPLRRGLGRPPRRRRARRRRSPAHAFPGPTRAATPASASS